MICKLDKLGMCPSNVTELGGSKLGKVGLVACQLRVRMFVLRSETYLCIKP